MKKMYDNRDEVRKNAITVPLNAAEKAIIKEKASKLGMTVSAFCRFMLVAGGER